MATLKGQKLAGFAIIIPPEGEAIEFTLLGAQADVKSFYALLADKLKLGMEQNQYGGVRMPSGIR